MYFGDAARARIHLYSDEVMDPLRRVPGVSFVPIEHVIESARRKIEHAPPDEAERIYGQLDRYYFRSAGERGRQIARSLRAAVDAKGPGAR